MTGTLAEEGLELWEAIETRVKDWEQANIFHREDLIDGLKDVFGGVLMRRVLSRRDVHQSQFLTVNTAYVIEYYLEDMFKLTAYLLPLQKKQIIFVRRSDFT